MQVDNGHQMRPPRARVLAVSRGQVVCPRRGIVDLERCWACPAYRGLTTGHREALICDVEPVFLSIAARWSVGRLEADGPRVAGMGDPVEDIP